MRAVVMKKAAVFILSLLIAFSFCAPAFAMTREDIDYLASFDLSIRSHGVYSVKGGCLYLDRRVARAALLDLKGLSGLEGCETNLVTESKSDARFSTGDTVAGNITLTVIVVGDYDCDGLVTAKDARRVLRVSATLDDLSSSDALRACDCDGDGKLDAQEARLTLRASASIKELPVPRMDTGVSMWQAQVGSAQEAERLCSVFRGFSFWRRLPDAQVFNVFGFG